MPTEVKALLQPGFVHVKQNNDRFCEALKKSTLSSFLLLNPKEFREKRRVDLPIPNQSQRLIKLY